jgi:hypothetical protein
VTGAATASQSEAAQRTEHRAMRRTQLRYFKHLQTDRRHLFQWRTTLMHGATSCSSLGHSDDHRTSARELRLIDSNVQHAEQIVVLVDGDA